MPWQAIALILLVVALYILADAFFDVSAKVSKATRGWSLPSFNLAPLAAFFGANWLRMAILGGLVAAVPLGCAYIERNGANKIIARVERENTVNVQRQASAQSGLERDVLSRVEANARIEEQIEEELRDVVAPIMEASGPDAIAAAHAAAVQRLRDNAAARHAAAISSPAA